MSSNTRQLRVFLCHASQDKSTVRELQQRLADEGWIDPWLDEKKLHPGEDWRVSIEDAVESSDSVVVCLSNNSVDKEGFVQKELRYAREIALEKSEGTIFLIPLRLEDCNVPRGLRFFQWADYFGEKKEQNYNELLDSFSIRRQQIVRREQERALREAKEKIERESSVPSIAKVTKRKLKVFLCHSSRDKPNVEKFYNLLVKDGFDVWLDKKNLIAGQDWQLEIKKAVRNSDTVIVFLSSSSTTKEGFVQKEIRFALDIADEKPEGTIFIIPARLEICDVPERISKFHWVDLFENDGYTRLIRALQIRTNTLSTNVNVQ